MELFPTRDEERKSKFGCIISFRSTIRAITSSQNEHLCITKISKQSCCEVSNPRVLVLL